MLYNYCTPLFSLWYENSHVTKWHPERLSCIWHELILPVTGYPVTVSWYCYKAGHSYFHPLLFGVWRMSADRMLSVFMLVPGLNMKVPMNIIGPYFCLVVWVGTAVGTRCADHVTPLYPQKLALTLPTGGSRSVSIVRVRTKATEFSLV